MRFSLEIRRWYACELIGDEFDDDICSYSPIKIIEVNPLGRTDRTLELHFYHANYPEGVRDKIYKIRTIERGERFLLAKSIEHNPSRILQIYDINFEWIERHFPNLKRDCNDSNDIQTWLKEHL